MDQAPKNLGTPNPPKIPKRRNQPKPNPGSWAWLILIICILGLLLWTTTYQNPQPVQYGTFVRLIFHPESKHIQRIVYVGIDKVKVELKPDAVFEVKEFKEAFANRKSFYVQRVRLDDSKTYEKLNEMSRDGNFEWDQQEDWNAGLGTLVMFFLPLVLFVVFFFLILPRFRDPMGGGFLSNYIKSPAKRYEKNKARITFEDVAGTENAKLELTEIVEFLKTPEKFQLLGAVVPKGVLLVGPPGTGKTLLAKAVAGEAGVPFYSISGSEFIQMFVGVGASRVRDMFKTAKDNAPCILFIDEIDAVGRMRGAGLGGGSDEREQTLNQILSEMDGFTPSETVIVMAATNRPDVLDSALLRPGRFDRHVTVDRPTLKGRIEILKVHTRNKPLAEDVNLDSLARRLIGMTGADLKNLANEAAIVATRKNKTKIDRADFEMAMDRVLIGAKREDILSTEAKRRVAYHEAGHVLVTWFLPGTSRPQKVSIIPRGRTLGLAWIDPEEDRHFHGVEFFHHRLVINLGGRAADRLVFGEADAGAESDLKNATGLARKMVANWGMSAKVGPVAFRMGEEHVFLGREVSESRDFSDGMAYVIDEEVQRFLREADEKALEILTANRKFLDIIAEELVQKEEILGDDLEDLMFKAGLPGAKDRSAAPTEALKPLPGPVVGPPISPTEPQPPPVEPDSVEPPPAPTAF